MTREGQAPVRLTAADFAKLARQQVKATDQEQKAVTFEGVLLRDALQPLELSFGKDLRGKALTVYLLIEAQDGYQVVFTLPELDALFTEKVVLLPPARRQAALREGRAAPNCGSRRERQARWIRRKVSACDMQPENNGAKNPRKSFDSLPFHYRHRA
jgi:hypothetical protein